MGLMRRSGGYLIFCDAGNSPEDPEAGKIISYSELLEGETRPAVAQALEAVTRYGVFNFRIPIFDVRLPPSIPDFRFSISEFDF